MSDVLLGPGVEVVYAQDLVAVGYQSLAEMRSEKPGASCDHHPLHAVTSHNNLLSRCDHIKCPNYHQASAPTSAIGARKLCLHSRILGCYALSLQQSG